MTASQTPVTYGTQRKAAARNRVAILEVAHELLAESAAVSMNEIAKRAGVGAGTLYRHFPTREDLILAVYRHDVQKLVDSVYEILATHPPLEAFTAWFESLAAYVRVKHGLGEALHNAAIQNAIDETYAPVVAAVTSCSTPASPTTSSARASTPPTCCCSWATSGVLRQIQDGIHQGSRLTQIVLDGIRTGRPGDDHA